MSPLAIAGLLLASGIHSVWNLRIKQSRDQQSFLILAAIVSTVILLPFMLLRWAPVSPTAWLIILVSGICEAAYFLLLGRAYHHGDLSLVYPISRGSSPLFVVLIAATLMGERISPLGGLGIALTIVGIYIAHLRAFARDEWLRPLYALRERTSQLALLSGLAVAGYSVSDKLGVGHLDPVVYYALALAASVLILAPYALTRQRAALALEWHMSWRSIIGVAAMIVVGYLIILFILAHNPVSYATAVRGASVVFGALLGTYVLHEPLGDKKIVGALVICAGIICIGLAG